MLQVVFVRYLSDMFPSHSLYVPLSLSLLLALTTFYYPCVCAHLSCVWVPHSCAKTRKDFERKVVLPSGPATQDGKFHVKMSIMLCKYRILRLLYSWLLICLSSERVWAFTAQSSIQDRRPGRGNSEGDWGLPYRLDEGGRVGGKVIFHVTEVTPVLSPGPHQEGSGQDSVGLFFYLAATLSSLWPHACLCKLWPRL